MIARGRAPRQQWRKRDERPRVRHAAERHWKQARTHPDRKGRRRAEAGHSRQSGCTSRTVSGGRHPKRWYLALAYTVRDRMLLRWVASAQTYKSEQARTVCYLSAEFLIGPHLGINLINLEIWDNVDAALTQLGLDLEQLLDQEKRASLGNGGLGRLAACYLDSLATTRDPGHRLRYPLRVRYLRPTHRRRLAGRGDGQVAATRQPLGATAPEVDLRHRVRRTHRALPR